MTVDVIEQRTRSVLQHFLATNRRLVTAESCTGGLLSGYLTSVAGASRVFDRGYVTYSNHAKITLLDISPEQLEIAGAVSGDVAEAMARGALCHSEAHVAISISGIAGPEGGTPTKPIGLTYFGLASLDQGVWHWKSIFIGDRYAIRNAAVAKALELLLET